MKRLFPAAMLILSWVALAQGSAPKAADVKAYVFELLERDVAIQQIAALQRAGYSPEDVERIVRSEPFRDYLRAVARAPAIVRQVDRRVEQILAPGYLEDKIRAELAAAESARREELNQALSVIERFRARPAKELGGEAPGFFDRWWAKFKRELFG